MGKGAMIMVSKDFDSVAHDVANIPDLTAAIKSSPNSTVVSGSIEAVEGYVEELTKQEIRPLRVKSDIAFHRYNLY